MKRFIALIFVVVFIFPSPVLAYLPLTQTDWSEGYGQQVWSDTTKFKEHYHIDYNTKGELKIPGNDTWYDPAWKYRQKIVIDNSEQGELDHVPVLVILEHKVNIDYRKLQSATGNDLRFTDSDGQTLIPYDVERWDQSGKSFIWVKIPTIDDHSDKDYFYLYYGNPSAVTTENPASVWDNGYLMVHHFDELVTNGKSYHDATDEAQDAPLTDADNITDQVIGQIGLSHRLKSSSTRYEIDLGSSTKLEIGSTTPMTIEAWVNVDEGDFRILGNRSSVGYFLFIENSAGAPRFIIDGGTGNCTHTAAQNVYGHGWKYVALTMKREGGCAVTNDSIRIFVDGKRDASSATTDSGINHVTSNLDSSDSVCIASSGASCATPPAEGMIDEVRFSNVVRSPDWIEAQYLSMTNKYLSFGNEELFGSELLSSIFDAGNGKSWGYLSYTADELDKAPAKVKIRTGNNMYLNDAPDFATCDSVTNKTDISTNNCVVDGHRFIQYQVILDSTETNKTPTFKDIAITDYLPSQTKPVVKGISSIASPIPTPALTSPASPSQGGPKPKAKAGPKPSPSTAPGSALQNFFNALFH